MGIFRTAASWTTAEKPAASKYTAEIQNLWIGLQAAWDTYTPAWTSSGTAPALGNGSIQGKYYRVGKTVDFEVLLTPGSTTTFGTGVYSISLPPGMPSASDGMTTLCHAQLLIGGSRWPGQIVISSAQSTCQPFLATSATDPRLTQMGPAAPGTFANGNTLRLTGRYEAA